MCGISGIISWQHGIRPLYQEAAGLASLLVHRGPDNTRTEMFGDCVILSSNRLAITDPVNFQATMPFYDRESGTAFIFNGEIYNHRSLRNSLKHYRLRTNSDGEVLFALLIEQGQSAFDKVEGMFSFCFVDIVKGTALFGVDPTGQKPLFYNVQDDTLTFSSEMTPLLLNRRIKKTFDMHGVTEAICRRHIGGMNTHISEIKKLRSGHILEFSSTGTDIRRYYQIPFSRQDLADAELASKHLYRAVQTACESTYQLEVPAGALLSGGIDSSIVVAEAARCKVPLKTYSIGFEPATGPRFQSDWSTNEFPFSREVAEAYGTEHHEILMSIREYFQYFDRWSALSDLPMFFHEAPCLLKLFEVASHDVKVVFTGSGADEVLDGYSGLAAQRAGQEIQESHGSDLQGVFARMFAIDCRAYDCDLNRLLPDRELDRHARANMSYDLEPYIGRGLATSQLVLAMMFHGRLASYEFTEVDRASMHVSVEARSPLAEKSFISAAASFSPSLRYRDDSEKWILKKAMQGRLPANVLNRKKGPFPMPTEYFFSDHFAERVDAMFDESSHLESVGIDLSYLKELWNSSNPLHRPIFPRLVGLHALLKRHSPFLGS